MYSSDALSPAPDSLLEGFTLSVRKNDDFLTDASAVDLDLVTDVYYVLTPIKANDPLDSSKL